MRLDEAFAITPAKPAGVGQARNQNLPLPGRLYAYILTKVGRRPAVHRTVIATRFFMTFVVQITSAAKRFDSSGRPYSALWQELDVKTAVLLGLVGLSVIFPGIRCVAS